MAPADRGPAPNHSGAGQAGGQSSDRLASSRRYNRGVVLASAVGTGSTVDGVVRVRMRRTITSRGDVRRAGGPGMTPLMASHKEAGAMGGFRVG